MADSIADLKSIFGGAVEMQTAAEREAYLDRACGADPRLRAEVESLLAAGQDVGSFFDGLKPPSLVAECPGTVIGSYKLLEQIGEGGFGVVFMAEQQQPIRRKVALKVIKPGMDTRQVVARFEAERQALALMDHPNIAHVIDGGETASGRPYFVMELVRGVPITDFCDQNQLPVRDRLELFVSICQAVQHAHQKGIIHRDLKPSNVLVTMLDNVPVAKVIDFGIVKAIGQQLTDKTLFTNFAQMIGTPLYMSPEQAQMSAVDVDTRSDIYSLGVLLYELLTGTTPFDKERLQTAGYDEIRRIIRDEEPAKPSTRLSTLGQAASTASANRKSDPRRLSQLLRGELDWIAMKCLEKDRNRRYESASALALDVQRYLHDEPVLAGPPSARYRMAKFVRRNRRPVLATSVGLALLVAGTIGTTIGFVRARAERDDKELARQNAVTAAEAEKKAREGEADQRAETEAVRRYMVDALRAPDPALGGAQLKVVDLLNQAAAKLDREFADSPKIKGAFLSTLGQTYLGLGLPKEATRMFEKARDVLEAAYGVDDANTLNAMYGLAGAFQADGRRREALALYEETLNRRKVTLGVDDPETLSSMVVVARALLLAGRANEAVSLNKDALARLNGKVGPDHPYTIGAMGDLGLAYQRIGWHDKALTQAETVRNLRQAKDPNHPETFVAMSNLAFAYQAAGRLSEAIPLFEATLKLRKERLGPNHSDTYASMFLLAGALVGTERRADAMQLYDDAINGLTALLGADNPRTLMAVNDVVPAYLAAGQLADALVICEKTLELRKAKLGPEHYHTVGTMALHGLILLKAKEYARAELVLNECLGIRVKNEPNEWTTFSTRSMLGEGLLGQKKFTEAETQLLEGYRGMKVRENRIPAQAKPRLIESLERLVQLYEAWGKKDEAEKWKTTLELQRKQSATR